MMTYLEKINHLIEFKIRKILLKTKCYGMTSILQ